MKKARILSSGYRFTVTLFWTKAQGKFKRIPRKQRLTSVLQEWQFFYYDHVANSVQRTLKEMDTECAFTIRRQASQALKTLEDTGYILRGNGADGDLHIFFIPALFKALNVRPDPLRTDRLKAERVQRKRGMPS